MLSDTDFVRQCGGVRLAGPQSQMHKAAQSDGFGVRLKQSYHFWAWSPYRGQMVVHQTATSLTKPTAQPSQEVLESDVIGPAPSEPVLHANTGSVSNTGPELSGGSNNGSKSGVEDQSKSEIDADMGAKPSRVVRPAGQRGQKPTAQVVGEETRIKIINAAIETLNTEGIVGASARAIARVGGFNQALIFYHFGSVEGLLVAAAKAEGRARSNRYSTRFAEVRTLAELVTIARAVHSQEQQEGAVNVLTQMLAGAASAPALRAGLYEAMTPWLELVEDAIRRVVEGSPLASFVPLNDLAFAIASLFIGLELMTSLDPSGERATNLFDSIEKLSNIVEMFMKASAGFITPNPA